MSEEIKQEIKETVTKLTNANLNFTVEDELEFAKVAVKSAEQKLEQVKQENKRLLEIINAKPLETVDMDCAFEIEKLKEQLQAKEQECERLRKQYNCNACGTCNGKEDYKNMQKHCEKAIAQNHKYKQELKPFKDTYFKGLYNQIIAGLAKKSIRLTTENRKLEQALDEIEEFCMLYCDNHDAYETVYKYILSIINKANTAPTTIFDKNAKDGE
jgi:hypothetical protein